MTGDEFYERVIEPIEGRMIGAMWRIVRDRDDADDAMQEALANVWRQLARIARHPNPEALVMRICVNAAYDVLRRKARRRKHEGAGEAGEGVADRSTAGQETVQSAEEMEALLGAIARLPRRQAEAMLMHVVGGEPYSAVAAALGCSEATVRTHVKRARLELASLFPELAGGQRRQS